MPIDRSLLEPARPGFDPELLDWARKQSQQNAEKDKLRINANRDAYAWGLVSPLAGTRKVYQKRVLNEVKDPYFRKKLLEDVSKIAAMQEWQDRQERAEAGYAGRFAKDAQKVGGAFADAGTGMVEAAKDLGNLITLRSRSPEDVKFMRGLEQAQASRGYTLARMSGDTSEDPNVSMIDTPGKLGEFIRNIAKPGSEGAAGMAPDMAAGMAALAVGGPAASVAYWTARGVSESREDFIEMGVDPGKATALGLGTSALVGALEQAIPDPTGLVKGKGIGRQVIRGFTKKVQRAVGKKLASPLAKRAIGGTTGALARIAGEIAEEGVQAATDEAIKYNVAARDDDIENRDIRDIGRKAAEAMIEAGPGIAVLGGAGGVASMTDVAKNFKRKSVGFKQSKMETEIMRFAQTDEVPTRKQWAKWGGLAEEGFSMKNRKAGVKSIAGRLMQNARVRTVIEGQTPTEQQWKDWGFDPEEGLTAEDRKRFLFAKFEKGFKTEQEETRARQRVDEELRQRDENVAATVSEAKIATEGAVGQDLAAPGLTGVLSQAEALEGAVQPPADTAGLSEAMQLASGLSEVEAASFDPSAAAEEQEGQIIPTEGQEAVSEAPAASGGISEATEPAGIAEQPDPKITDEVDITDAVKESSSAVGNFIKDSAGRIGIDIEQVERGLKKAKGIGARFALSRGELPQSVFEAKIKKEGFEAKIETRLRFTVKKFRKLEKEVFGKDGMSRDDMMVVKAALQDDAAAMNSLSPEIRSIVSEIRQQVDALSAQLRSTGAIAGDLAVVIEGNEGTYLTTTYKAFQGPKWAQDVPQEIKNAYADFIRKEFPNETNEEIDGLIEKILYDAEQSGSPIAMAKQARLGAKDVSILTPKKDLPAELKALLGEEKDPILNYAMSVTKLGSLIANHQFQVDIRNANGGEYFSKNAIAGTDKGDMVAEIELANEQFHTTPELKAALDREYQRDVISPWLRPYMKANAAVKISKTLLSQQAQTRNIEANVLLSVANGHWRLGMIKPAWKATWANFTGKGSKASQNLIESAVEYQVVGQDVRAGELKDLVNDAANSPDIESHMYSYEARRASIAKKALRGGLRVAARAYQAGDDFFKLYAWLNERARYKKAYPNATGAEIKQMAADVVRDTFPNYSLIPEGVKQIRKLPFVGSFVSFRSEMIRTSYKMLLLTRKEIANPETREIGYARLAGMSAAAIAIPSLANALRLFYKVSKQDEEDLRLVALPDYQKNSTLAHTTGNIDGEFGIIDLTYVDPHGSFRQMFNAFVTGEDFEDSVLGALQELFEPFISDEILFAKLIDVRRNWKKKGGKIYNEEDNLGSITGDIVAHIWDAFEPGSVTSAERGIKGLTGYVSEHGQTYNAAVEAGAAFLGQRVSNRSVRDSMPFVVKKLNRRKIGAEDILTSVISRGGRVSDTEISEAYVDSRTARESIYNETKAATEAAVRLLKSYDEVSGILKESGVSLRDRNAIFSGVYAERKYSKAFISKVRRANPKEFEARMAALAKAIEEENSEKE